jgi:AMMECR1 domain-containing protein
MARTHFVDESVGTYRSCPPGLGVRGPEPCVLASGYFGAGLIMNIRILIVVTLLTLSATAAFADPVLDGWRHVDPSTKAYALTLARRAFDTYITKHEVIDCPDNVPALLRSRAGVFVSTMAPDGAPRCCMGTVYPLETDIAHEIIANAVTAAGRDRRFRPIKPSEMSTLRLIVSIVGRPIPIDEHAADALDPVRDGLVVKNGDHFGVMLSGETGDHTLMLKWGRKRAGAGPTTHVEFFRIDDVRLMEGL